MKNCIFIFVWVLSFKLVNAQHPISLCADNPHYLQYNGKTILLITAAEHYGSLVNLDFDYLTYLNEIARDGMNYTRIFSGSTVEREEDIKWMEYRNTLAPKPGRIIVPWARSAVDGYNGGGKKFDLERWDDRYFERLKDIVSQAQKRNVIVEFTFFGNQYNDGLWMNSPLYPGNNIQGIGPSGKNSFKIFQTLHDTALVQAQERMVTKILKELNGFDNLFYEISNEPYNEAVDSSDVDDWHRHMVEIIQSVEKDLPKKHLIATNESVVDDPGVSIANYHYVKVKTMPAFDYLLSLDKVISMDETTGSLIHSDPDDVRVEAWDFLMRGGGVYNNLSWEHTPDREQGTEGARVIRGYLKNLQEFFKYFDLTKLHPEGLVMQTDANSAFLRVLGEKGKQYAGYLHHSKIKGEDWIVGYDAVVDRFVDTISVTLPRGRYKMTWTNPSTGKPMGPDQIVHSTGAVHVVTTPEFTTDIAIRLKRIR